METSWGSSLIALAIGLLLITLWLVQARRRRAAETGAQLAKAVVSLEEIYHRSPIMMYSIDQHAVVTRVNEAWLSAMGYAEHEVVGQPTRSFLMPACVNWLDEQCDGQLHRDLLQNGVLKNLRVQFFTRDGSPLHASITANLLTSPDGEVRGAHCIIIDETKHFFAERELRQSREHNRQTFATLPIPMFHCATDGLYLRANSAALECMGVATLAQLNTLGHERQFDLARGELLSRGSGVSANYNLSLPGLGGELRDVRMSVRLVQRDGQPPFIEGAYVDVTELEATRREAARSWAYNRNLYDSTPVMMYTVDARGVVNDVNQFWLEKMGYARDEVIGRKGFDFLCIEDRQSLRESAIEQFARHEPIMWETKMVTKDGAFLEGRIHGAPLVDEAGAPDGAMCSFIDLTEQRAMAREKELIEDELATAQKLEAIGQLAAGIAHEINTPSQYVSDNLSFIDEALGQMQPLLAYVRDCLRDDDPIDVVRVQALAAQSDLAFLLAEMPSAITQSREGIATISKIVRAMKEFSHPGSESPEPTDINRLIRSVTVVARNEWKYQAEMILQLDEDCGNVPCVPPAFGQVLLNIIVNAGQAIGDARARAGSGSPLGQITVRSWLEDDWAHVSICDTGTGMDESTRKKIFNPFFTTKEIGRGTGQGLAIAHRIMTEKHGGTVGVESTPGVGSTFKLSLPRSRQQPAQSAA